MPLDSIQKSIVIDYINTILNKGVGLLLIVVVELIGYFFFFDKLVNLNIPYLHYWILPTIICFSEWIWLISSKRLFFRDRWKLQEKINELGYPDKRPDNYRYEIFNTEPSYESGNQYSDLVKEIISKPGHIEGVPFFITSKNNK